MENFKQLLENLDEEHLPADNVAKFPILLASINRMFDSIKNCKNIDDAKIYFDLLQKAQMLISKSICFDELNVPAGLCQFFKDFDRLDDMDTKIFFFNKIKNENYRLPEELVNKLILKYDPCLQFYIFNSISDQKSSILAQLLVQDISCKRIDFIKNFINDKVVSYLENKVTYLLKNDMHIAVGFVEELSVPGSITLSMDLVQFMNILDRWQEACEKKPNRIIITRNNGKITVDFED